MTMVAEEEPESSGSGRRRGSIAAAGSASSKAVVATRATDVHTQNIQYMKLLHELKAQFPAVSDHFVKECVTRHGDDRELCSELLIEESERLKRCQGPLKSRFNLHRQVPDLRFVPRGAGEDPTLELDSANWSSRSECSSDDDLRKSSFCRRNPTQSGILPTVVVTPESPPRDFPYEPRETHTIFRPEELSPKQRRRRGKNSSDNGGLVILGNAKSLTATCLDLEVPEGFVEQPDIDSASEASMDSSVCSLSTTTVSKGELQVLHYNKNDQLLVPIGTTAFTSIRCKSISVSPSAKEPVTRTTSCSTVFTIPKMTTTTAASGGGRAAPAKHDGSSAFCPENPFRKVFAKRKEFYQAMANQEQSYSSVNRLLWRRRHCSLCCGESRPCNAPANGAPPPADPAAATGPGHAPNVLTFKANIQPFAPFTLKHNVGARQEAELTLDTEPKQIGTSCSKANSSSSDLVRTLGEGIELSPDGQELRYATSTINSEEGVESHLEVSLGKDGSVITTRHKRLGSPSEIANNSVLQVGFDAEGRKVLSFQQTSQKRRAEKASAPRPNSLNLCSVVPGPFGGLSHGGSAYCTQLTQESAPTGFSRCPKYNSLPNLVGRVPSVNGLVLPMEPGGGGGNDAESSAGLVYTSHPADEEKRIAFTRALLSHQMQQRLNLEHELRNKRAQLVSLRSDVLRLKETLDHKEMLLGCRNGVVSTLKEEISELQLSCDQLAEEVNRLTGGKVPLCETSPYYYENLAPEIIIR